MRSERALGIALLVAGCATVPRGEAGWTEEGKATWYGARHHGGPTASGERFDMNALTAAHKTLRLGSTVEVENLRNGRRVVVRINDRGPYGAGRIIDVSLAAAKALDMVDAGVVPCRIRVVPPGPHVIERP